MRWTFLLAGLCLNAGCGDIIKAKNPVKKYQPYQPTYLHDETGICPYYPAVWSGLCEGEGRDSQRLYFLDVSQTACRLFVIQSTADFEIDQDRRHEYLGLQYKTRATWLNSDRSQLQLQENWTEKELPMQRDITLDHSQGLITETVSQLGEPARRFYLCRYQRQG